MKTIIRNFASCALFGAAVSFLAITQGSLVAASSQESSAEKQKKLIAILQSDAPPQDKAIPCKELAIYGTKDAVPLLTPLLANKELASWARIALEAIPGPEADEALRSMVPKLQGRLLIGTMNSIGIRRDAKAVDVLATKLADADLEIVAAAGAALGNIGGVPSAKLLNQWLANPRKEIVLAVSEGGILCAERFLADGKFGEATQLYDVIRAADVSKQRRLEATRGAILARQSDGLPLLLEQLRSADYAVFGMALRTARELQGGGVTEALGAEMDRAVSDRQVMLVLALADRRDSAVFPKLLQAAEKSFAPTRVAVLGMLDKFGDLSAVTVLLNASADADANVARAAKATLTRMEGKPVDAAILARLSQSSGKTREAILELAGLRRIEVAMPGVLASAEDADKGVRRAAFNTLGLLGSEQQVGDMVRLLSKTQNAEDRDDIERALTGICGRSGARCLPQVLPLARNNDSGLRIIALRSLAAAGGPEALAAVKTAVNDSDEGVQDEAVGTLATWPNNWPDDTAVAEPLLTLAKSGKKTSHKVQGARGYLLYVQQNKNLSNADKVTAINGLLPDLKQPQQKRLAIATLSGIPTAGALDLLMAFAGDPALADEAGQAIVTVATAKGPDRAPKEARRKALQTAVEKVKSDTTRKKADEALKAIK